MFLFYLHAFILLSGFFLGGGGGGELLQGEEINL